MNEMLEANFKFETLKIKNINTKEEFILNLYSELVVAIFKKHINDQNQKISYSHLMSLATQAWDNYEQLEIMKK